MVAHGFRFMLGRVAGPKKAKGRQKKGSRHAGLFTCLQTPSSVSHAFIEIATGVIQQQHDADIRLRASSASSSNNNSNNKSPSSNDGSDKAPTYPLLQPDVLDSLECALFMDVEATSATAAKHPRATIGELSKLLLQLWDILLASCIPWSTAALQETIGFNDQLKRQKAESLMFKLMERREFAKVYEAYVAVTEDTIERWSKADVSSQRSHPPFRKSSTWVSKRRQTSSDPDVDAVYAYEAPPLAKDPVQLLERYINLSTRTLVYAAALVQVHRPFFVDVLAVLYCRLPSLQRLVLDLFDRFGFSGTPPRKPRFLARAKSFFQEDNSAFYGWDRFLDDVALETIETHALAALDVILETPPEDASAPYSESDIFMDDHARSFDGEDRSDGDNNCIDSSLCLDLFLSLWMATTEHIQRTSRGHIPWADVPPFAALQRRAANLFEKSFAYQTFDCDEDTNGLRFHLISTRKAKLDRRLPFDVKHPRVVFSTIEAIVMLTQQSFAPYMAAMYEHLNCFYVRSAVPSLALLEQWITHAPTACIDNDATQALLRKFIVTLLSSDRMDRLKAIQVFLLHCIGHFAVPLQKHVLSLLVDAFPRLFGHWSRDVRFCYHLLLIYIFGDRRQLGAHSDSILLGLDESGSTHVEYEPFDHLLLETLRASKAPPLAYERASFTEYIAQLEMYYSIAATLPKDEAVAIPRIRIQQAHRG
ncbi:hypothetical protein SDRG_13617 [Saprolegnia diclina VS20]|uniref:Uncharacterized protein n=1 Tax=Saprolegnia diclina (strain VS20) TaxID=1156394 RepID=T0PSR7_SAPDV|nr:hypothetical protein SDRG_13617 [Saprolegnia diclina VS20]EQC28539.1 hypothetical protein SDRG_13617 [Saprolegnia diclina VS20]|eukprot:XP_008617936.1 hypothetical protein SDRG_13617 [Saprolegnia diclina VS20]